MESKSVAELKQQAFLKLKTLKIAFVGGRNRTGKTFGIGWIEGYVQGWLDKEKETLNK